MKKMWIQIKEGQDPNRLKRELSEIGSVEKDDQDPRRLFLTFHNQSESGLRMAGYRLSQDFLDSFEDFDMIWETARGSEADRDQKAMPSSNRAGSATAP